MTKKNSLGTVGRLALINAIPLFLVLTFILDMTNAINEPGSYPFGNSINEPTSIYTSPSVYIIYNLVAILCLLSLILLSFFYKRYRLVYFIILGINLLLLLYPIITTRD